MGHITATPYRTQLKLQLVTLYSRPAQIACSYKLPLVDTVHFMVVFVSVPDIDENLLMEIT